MYSLSPTAQKASIGQAAGSYDDAFAGARAILRQDGAMTVEQFHELDELLSKVSLVQFTALTTDELHLTQLRQYEIMAWRHPRAAAPVLAVFLLCCLAGVVALVWT